MNSFFFENYLLFCKKNFDISKKGEKTTQGDSILQSKKKTNQTYYNDWSDHPVSKSMLDMQSLLFIGNFEPKCVESILNY